MVIPAGKRVSLSWVVFNILSGRGWCIFIEAFVLPGVGGAATILVISYPLVVFNDSAEALCISIPEGSFGVIRATPWMALPVLSIALQTVRPLGNRNEEVVVTPLAEEDPGLPTSAEVGVLCIIGRDAEYPGLGTGLTTLLLSALD